MRHIHSMSVLVWIAMLLVAAGRAVAPAHAQPPAPAVAAQAQFPIMAFDGDAALMNVVVDFAPGASTPDHTHGGPVIALVLDGEITLHDADGTKTYKAGTFWTELPGHVHHAGNEGSAPARVSVVGLVPKGGRLTTPDAQSTYKPALATTTAMQTQFPLGVAAGEAVLTDVIVDFAPGAATPQHVHGGPVLATVLTGAITVHDPDATHVYRAGEFWTEFPNHPHYAVNEGAEMARVSVSAILPKGAALTSPVPQPGTPAALPRTGDVDDWMLPWLLASGAAAIIAGTWVLRRAMQRRR
jgi:quercetin dioxygenase-like cupin family protein